MTNRDGQASATDALREAGLRATAPRIAVYDTLRELPHASAEAVHETMLTRLPRTPLQSVYNVLNDLAEAGLVRRIEPAGRPMLFEVRVGDNHHHLVCSRCGTVVDVDCVLGSAPCLTPSDDHGFLVEVAEVTFWGTCPSCATTNLNPPTAEGSHA